MGEILDVFAREKQQAGKRRGEKEEKMATEEMLVMAESINGE